MTSRFAIRKPEKAIDSIEAHELESAREVCWSTDFCARRVLVQRFFTTLSGGGIGKSAHPNGAYKFAGPGQGGQLPPQGTRREPAGGSL